MNKRELVIEVTRGRFVESRHQVIAVVCDTKGKRHSQWGNVDQQVFPRSTAKPLQALPLMLSGAAQDLNLTQRQLAMSCSSHNGETQHSDVITAWLDQLAWALNSWSVAAIGLYISLLPWPWLSLASRLAQCTTTVRASTVAF